MLKIFSYSVLDPNYLLHLDFLSKANIGKKTTGKSQSHIPNTEFLLNFFAISKFKTIINIDKTGGNNSHRVHPPGLHHNLNIK
jgi:hypothetical protein